MKKKKYFAIICIAVLFLIIGIVFYVKAFLNTKPILPGEEDEEQSLVDVLRQSSVMITVGDYRGSGVIFSIDDEELTILTAAHLMENFDQGIISFPNGKVGFGNVSICSPKYDLCFLTLKKTDMSSDFFEGLQAAKHSLANYSELVEQEQVYLVGSLISVGENTMIGKIASKDYYVPDFDLTMLYLYADIFEGMSGAGCFDSDGSLIGIVVGGNNTGEAVCVTIKDIYKCYENE